VWIHEHGEWIARNCKRVDGHSRSVRFPVVLVRYIGLARRPFIDDGTFWIARDFPRNRDSIFGLRARSNPDADGHDKRNNQQEDRDIRIPFAKRRGDIIKGRRHYL
jgi:hypothetical protein